MTTGHWLGAGVRDVKLRVWRVFGFRARVWGLGFRA